MDPSRSQLPMTRYFAGLAEYAFHTRLGVVDPPLVQYISELLARFIHRDTIFRVRNPRGQQLYQMAEMLVEAEARQGDARREVHRHIGDFTLFWTGVYPEALQNKEQHAKLDFFQDYCQTGKRNYYLASTIQPANEQAPDRGVLERLSHDFDLCVYGLGEVRREWERRDEDDPASGTLLIE